MKSAIIILALLLVGCSEVVIEEPEVQEPVEPIQETTSQEPNLPPIPEQVNLDNQETVNNCNSLCEQDFQAYCVQERTILVDDKEVTGTCRAFSKKGNVNGFVRCPGFCTAADESTTVCGEDLNCDGVVG